jgi:hypothetical protein
VSDLDARYGRRPPVAGWMRGVLVTAGLTLLVLGVIGIFLMYQAGRPEARARLLAYEVVSDGEVQARIEVTKPADRDAVCDVIAQGEDTAVVGRTSTDITDDESKVVIEVTVATTSRAVLADVDGCRLG